MAITLDPILQARLDTEERAPRISVTSEAPDASIPFVGQKLHNVAQAEEWPYSIDLSTGAYAMVYSRKDDASHTNLYLKTSSTDRTTWNAVVALTSAASGVFYEYGSVTELSNGNLGVIVSERNGGVQKLRYLVVTTAGASVVAIADLNTTGLWYESTVIRLSDNTCLCVGARNNGGTWELVRFTHAAGNWGSWSASSTLAFGGATVTGEKRRPFIQEISAVGLSCWLMFDRVDLTSGSLKLKNIYFSKNTASPYLSGTVTMTKLTNLSQNYQADEGPSFVKPVSYATANAMLVAYVFRTTSIKLDNASTPQLPGTTDAWYSAYDASRDVIIMAGRDASTGLYIVRASDFVTLQHYTTATTPALHASAFTKIRSFFYNSGRVLLGYNYTNSQFDIVDIDAQTVTGILDTATPDGSVGSGNYRMTTASGIPSSCCLEGTKLWWITNEVYSSGGLSGVRRLWSLDIGNPALVGSINEVVPNPMRWLAEQNNVLAISNNVVTGQYIEQYYAAWDLPNKRVHVAFFFQGTATPVTQDNYGRLLTFSMEDTAQQIGRCDFSTNSSFPKTGISTLAFDGSTLYMAVPPNTTYLPAEPYGLAKMGLTLASGLYTDTVTVTNAAPVNRNTASSIVGLHIRQINPVGDGRVLVSTYLDGLGIYNGGAFTVYDETTVAGFPTDGTNPTPCMSAILDVLRNRVYIMLDGSDTIFTGNIGGIFIFDLDGDLVQPVYRIFTGINNAAPTSTGTEANLVNSDADDQIKIMSNGAGNSIAATWARQVSGSTTGEYDLMFDEDLGAIDLTPYITGVGRVVQTIEHQPNSYTFQVSNGQLFDPTNTRSLYRYVLDTGRKITLMKGELINGSLYLQKLFTGYVDSGKHSYKIPENPIRSVVAYDATRPGFDYELVLSPSYGDGTFPTIPDGDYPTPGIIAHMAFNLLYFKDTEIAVGSFGPDSAAIKLQLVSMSPADMIAVACNRFLRVPYVQYDGKLTAKKIVAGATPTDVFTDNRAMVTMNPNEGESENTNRVTVRAVSSESITVTYAAERITQSYGSLGAGINPNQGTRNPNINIYIPYSEDYSKVCANPFPVWKRWTSNTFPKPATFTPLTGQEVINNPTLINNPLVAGISPDDAARFFNDRGARLFLDTSWYNGPLDVWDYIVEVWAQPVGTIGQQIQASADDLAQQRRMRGHIVEQVVDFPAATTLAICQFMADWFLFRIQMARQPVLLQQAGHLKQEPGDTIEYTHPESGDLVTGIIITATRDFEVGGIDTQDLLLGVTS